MLWMLAKSCTTTTKRMVESQQWEYHLPQLVIFISQPSIDIHRVPICSHHFEEFPRFSYDFHRVFFIFPIFSYSFLYVPIICPYFPRHKQGKQLPALCISRFTMGDMGTVSAFGASVKPGKWERERTRDMAMNTLW